MSTESAAAGAGRPMEGHGLRLMIAVVACFLVGTIFDNLLVAFLAPVLATMFAAPDAPAPTLGRAVATAILIWLAAQTAGMISAFFAVHTDVLVLLLAALIFLCFWRDATAGPSPTVGLMLIVLVLVATMSANAAPLADSVVKALPASALIALVAVIVAYALVPSVGVSAATHSPSASFAKYPLRDAIVRTLIMLPLIVGFLVTEKSSGFYILITAIAVLRVPQPERAAKGVIAANVLGGALALLAAVLIMVTPSSLFGIVVLAILVLSLGLVVEAGGSRAMLAQAATGPAVILLMLALAPTDGSELYINRVVEIAATVVYVVLAQVLLGAVGRHRRLEELYIK